MDKKMYTAAEIAEMKLPNLPTTKGNVLARAEKEKWHFEVRPGLGGQRKLFKIPDLYLPNYTSPGAKNQTLREIEEAQISINASKAAESVSTAYKDGDIDPTTLASAIEIVDTYLVNNGKRLSNQRKGEVIVVVYNYLIGNKKESALLELLKMVA